MQNLRDLFVIIKEAFKFKDCYSNFIKEVLFNLQDSDPSYLDLQLTSNFILTYLTHQFHLLAMVLIL